MRRHVVVTEIEDADSMADRQDILVRFGTRVREFRRRAGLSQEEFASRCGLDRTYIGGIERGERNVSLRNIEVIANAFGIPIWQLVKDV